MSPANILIVENNQDYMNGLVDLFSIKKEDPYHILTACNPQEARNLLDQYVIHVAIVDIRLESDNSGSDLSGLDLCLEIDRDIPIILHSAHISAENIDIKTTYPTKIHYPYQDQLLDLYVIEKGSPNFQYALLEAVERCLQDTYEIYAHQRIGLLTSGGDSPGMNAAIWGIVRMAMKENIEVLGIEEGYRGLVAGKMKPIRWNQVSDIMINGGTMLKTARLKEFTDKSIRRKAIDHIRRKHLSGLIIIGGDGSMKGAQKLVADIQEMKDLKQLPEAFSCRTIVIPGTIDNDLGGTDMTLGADSAANAIVEVLRNMIRPAQAIKRIFVCEIMGRYSGYLALEAALGIGADAVLISENTIVTRKIEPNDQKTSWTDMVNVVESEDKLRLQLREMADQLEQIFKAGKEYGFVIMSEGIRLLTDNTLNAEYVQNYLRERIKDWAIPDKPDVRVHIVGYPIRGVAPSRFDVWLGVKMGETAVKLLSEKTNQVMVGWSDKEQSFKSVPFDEVIRLSNCTPQDAWKTKEKWQDLLSVHSCLNCPPKK
jgi:6-phosphofructokinase 1